MDNLLSHNRLCPGYSNHNHTGGRYNMLLAQHLLLLTGVYRHVFYILAKPWVVCVRLHVQVLVNVHVYEFGHGSE